MAYAETHRRYNKCIRLILCIFVQCVYYVDLLCVFMLCVYVLHYRI